MPLDLELTSPADLPELAGFLAFAFHTPTDGPFLETKLLEWKYLAPHPGWDGSRGYVLRRRGRIVAHGGLYPADLGRGARGMRVIDWAGSGAGSGVLLLRKLAELGWPLLARGGSGDARAASGLEDPGAPCPQRSLPRARSQPRPRLDRTACLPIRRAHGRRRTRRRRGHDCEPPDCARAALKLS